MNFFEPKISYDTASFWEGCKNHELQFQKCSVCQNVRWPASYLCPHCLSEKTELTVLKPEGTIYAYIVMDKPFHPSLSEQLPYIVALVDLEADVRIVTNLIDCNIEDVHCGDKVVLEFLDYDTYTKPVAKLKQKRTAK